MTREPIIVQDRDRPSTLSVVGTNVTILTDAAKTGGMGFTVQSGDEGTGPPPHCHPWDEAFFVMDGSVRFTVGDTTAVVESGGLAYVPAGTTHAFQYGPGGGRMLEVTSKGSRSAAMFTDFHNEMPGEPVLEKVSEIFARNDVRLMI